MTVHRAKKEDWMNKQWRPAMGWMYMLVCMADFIIFPVLWSVLQAFNHGQVTSQWQPLTLQGAGLFHLAMGGVLGVAAFGRTKEKLGGLDMGMSTPMSPPPQPYTPSYNTQNNNNLNNVTTGFNGKKSPPPVQEPML